MKNHTRLYFDAFRIDPTEIVLCECCGNVAQDIDHISARGLGGDPKGKKDRVENLMAVCRPCHVKFGNNKTFNARRYEAHKTKMILSGVEFCEEWIDKQIEIYK